MTNHETVEIYYPVEPRPSAEFSISLHELATSIAAELDKHGFYVLLFVPKRQPNEDAELIHGFIIRGYYGMYKEGDAKHIFDYEERSRQLIDESRRELVRAAKPRDRQKLIENLNRQPLPQINGLAYTPPPLREEDFQKSASLPAVKKPTSRKFNSHEISMGRIKTSKGTLNTDPGASEIVREALDTWCEQIDARYSDENKTLSRSDNILFFEALRTSSERALDALGDDLGSLGNL